MSPQACAFIVYFGGMLLIGYWANRRVSTLEDYLVAGRRLPFFIAVPTIVATWFGAGSCLGVSGIVYEKGVSGVIADPFGCSIALVIAGFFFAAKFRRLKLLTVADILRQKYGRKVEIFASFAMLPLYVGTLAGQMVALGYLFHLFMNVETTTGILLGSLIVVGYTTCGGMWAVCLTDLIQLVLLAGGLFLIVPIVWMNVPDVETFTQVAATEFQTLFQSDPVQYGWLIYAGKLLMTGLGAIMGQDLIQRSLASRSANVARWSAVVAAGVYLLLGLVPIFIGLAGRYTFPHLSNPEMLIPALAMRYLSPALILLFAVGIISAIMSTADSYLLAGTSILSQNIFLNLWPQKSEKDKLLMVRAMSLILSLLAFTIALWNQSIFELMVHSSATLFVTIFVPVTAALYWKGANRTCAWASMLGGTGSWVGAIFVLRMTSTLPIQDVLYASAAIGGTASGVAYLATALFFARAPKPIFERA